MKKGPSWRRQGVGGKKSWILLTASYSLTSVSSWVMQSLPTFDWCFCLFKGWKQTGESEGRDWVLTPQNASLRVGQGFPEISFSIYKVGIKCLSLRLVKAPSLIPEFSHWAVYGRRGKPTLASGPLTSMHALWCVHWSESVNTHTHNK